jgi:hypothetical protein
MATSRKSARPKPKPARRASAAGKVRKEFWLDPTALADAQAFLGTATERDTVEVALELVAFRRDLAKGTKALAGLPLSRID